MKRYMNIWNTGIVVAKRCFFVSAVLLFTASCQEARPEVTEEMMNAPEPGPTERDYGLYGIESGVLIRVFDRDSSREEIYFDRWGCRQARYEYIHMQGEDTTTLWGATINNGFTTHYLSLGNTYFSMPNNRMDNPVKWDSLGFEKERALAEEGYVCIGTKEAEGKPCKVWEYVMGNKDTLRSYIYKGILLKETEYKKGRHRGKEIAISLKENVKIPEEKFMVPENYTVRELTNVTNVYEKLLGH